ncbi:hypothetical protein SAMN05216344_13517 [Polaromonas sp. OV174]|uniref:hypothetical protein n=1 Tax=Polaromonas sp. OV174 TaxID=1855300 RepID=UPI0008F2AABC|nr:hypothetical protein [Polaromonas sp. OV174]SFC72486.1 hypothetical protein SAMN05216344_13517 [Polaromonas sp. OV174]
MVKKSARRTCFTYTPVFKPEWPWPRCAKTWALAERGKQFEMYANQITEWKRQLREHAADAFGGGAKTAEPVDLGSCLTCWTIPRAALHPLQ